MSLCVIGVGGMQVEVFPFVYLVLRHQSRAALAAMPLALQERHNMLAFPVILVTSAVACVAVGVKSKHFRQH